MSSTPNPNASALTPEEQIKANPALALDGKKRDRLRGDEMIACLLRWMQDPAAARGRSHYVPRHHPSGLGGKVIYVPANFPLPD